MMAFNFHTSHPHCLGIRARDETSSVCGTIWFGAAGYNGSEQSDCTTMTTTLPVSPSTATIKAISIPARNTPTTAVNKV